VQLLRSAVAERPADILAFPSISESEKAWRHTHIQLEWNDFTPTFMAEQLHRQGMSVRGTKPTLLRALKAALGPVPVVRNKSHSGPLPIGKDLHDQQPLLDQQYAVNGYDKQQYEVRLLTAHSDSTCLG